MTTETGGPAFPGLHPSKECHYQDAGMTLRDYFAGKAMQGMLAANGDSNGHLEYEAKTVAANAYILADAMLKARGA